MGAVAAVNCYGFGFLNKDHPLIKYSELGYRLTQVFINGCRFFVRTRNHPEGYKKLILPC